MLPVQAGLVCIAVAGVLFSAISAYFCIRVVMVMYVSEPKGSFELSTSPSLALAISATAVIVIGVYPTATS